MLTFYLEFVKDRENIWLWDCLEVPSCRAPVVAHEDSRLPGDIDSVNGCAGGCMALLVSVSQ